MSRSEDQNRTAWEISKENILPLSGGRKMSSLTNSLLDDSIITIDDRMRHTIDSMEKDILTCNGSDALEPWVKFIGFLQQHRLTETGEYAAKFRDTLIKCIRRFMAEPTYKNDRRFMDIYLKSIANQTLHKRINLLATAMGHGFGKTVAKVYLELAEMHEANQNQGSALRIIRQGLANNAEPREALLEFEKNLEFRMAAKVATAMKEADNSAPVRLFGAEVPLGPGCEPPSVRSNLSPALSAKTLPVSKKIEKVSIYSYDENGSSMFTTEGSHTDVVQEMERIDAEAENATNPTKWNAAGAEMSEPIVRSLEKVEVFVSDDEDSYVIPESCKPSKFVLAERKLDELAEFVEVKVSINPAPEHRGIQKPLVDTDITSDDVFTHSFSSSSKSLIPQKFSPVMAQKMPPAPPVTLPTSTVAANSMYRQGNSIQLSNPSVKKHQPEVRGSIFSAAVPVAPQAEIRKPVFSAAVPVAPQAETRKPVFFAAVPVAPQAETRKPVFSASVPVASQAEIRKPVFSIAASVAPPQAEIRKPIFSAAVPAARKFENNSVKTTSIQIQPPSNPKISAVTEGNEAGFTDSQTRSMYRKHELFRGRREISFEQLRAEKFLKSLPLPQNDNLDRLQKELNFVRDEFRLYKEESVAEREKLLSKVAHDQEKFQAQYKHLLGSFEAMCTKMTSLESQNQTMSIDIEFLKLKVGAGNPGWCRSIGGSVRGDSGSFTTQMQVETPAVPDGTKNADVENMTVDVLCKRQLLKYSELSGSSRQPYTTVETFQDMDGSVSNISIDVIPPPEMTEAVFLQHPGQEVNFNVSNLTHALNFRPRPMHSSSPDKKGVQDDGSDDEEEFGEIRHLPGIFTTPYVKRNNFNQTLQEVAQNLSTIQETSKEQSRSSTVSSNSSHLTTTNSSTRNCSGTTFIRSASKSGNPIRYQYNNTNN